MADGLKPHVLRGRGRSRRSRDRAEELRLGAPDPLRRRRELGDRSHMMSALILVVGLRVAQKHNYVVTW